MKYTSLFVLFKEYPDGGGTSFPLLKIGTDFSDREDVKKYLSHILSNLKFFDYEICGRFFAAENVKRIIPLSYVKERRVPSLMTMLLANLKQCGFRPVQVGTKTVFKYHGVDLQKCILNEMAESLSEKGCHAVLWSFDAIDSESGILPLKSNYNQSIEIRVVENVEELYRWFCENRLPQRHFDLNHKHGENGKGAWPGAAPLLCNRYEAQELLNKAVGKTKDGACWLYDANNRAFIYFENENQNPPTFHGYHVNKGDDNYENIDLEKLKAIHNLS